MNICIRRAYLLTFSSLFCIGFTGIANADSSCTIHLKSDEIIDALHCWEENDKIMFKLSSGGSIGIDKELVKEVVENKVSNTKELDSNLAPTQSLSSEKIPPEYKGFIGQKYWLLDNLLVEFSQAPTIFSENLRFQTPQGFTIQEIVIDDPLSSYKSYWFKVRFDSGKEAFLKVNSLKNNLDSRISKKDPRQIEYELRQILKNNGIVEGSTLWLKYPYGDMAGLSKITINSISIKRDILLDNQIFITARIENKKEEQISFYDYQIEKYIRYFYSKNPNTVLNWTKQTLNAIKEKKIFIGMTKEQAQASWGIPKDINKTVGAWGIHEQWVYGDYGPYLYFKNNKLTSWQD